MKKEEKAPCTYKAGMGTKCVDGLATALSSTIISEGASHESPSSLEEAEEEEPRLKATNTERVIATTNIT